MFVEFGWIAQHSMRYPLQVVGAAWPCVGAQDDSAREMLGLLQQLKDLIDYRVKLYLVCLVPSIEALLLGTCRLESLQELDRLIELVGLVNLNPMGCWAFKINRSP